VRPSRRCPDAEGRLATGPGDLSARAWLRSLRRTAEQAVEDHLLQRAAALAFFAMLSLFPALLALVSLLGLVGASALQPLIDNVSALAPGVAREIALDALRSIQAGEGAGSGFVIGLVLALWSASAYVGAFIPAANVVWEVDEERPLWRKLVLRLVLTIVLLVLTSSTAVIVLVTGPIAHEAGSVIGVGDGAVAAWQIAKWPFLAIVLMALVSLLYWASPNVRHPSWRWVTPGAVIAVGLWLAASAGFSYYISSFASYGETYGSIGGVLVFLLWLWLSNIAILLGAELDAELERTRAIEGGMRPVDKSPFLPLRHGS
jgi:membrane protein